MMNAAHQAVTGHAAAGRGPNWLELNNAGNDMAQTLGIRRQVDTVAGADYRLSLDLAGRQGYGADYTRIGIYVDGIRIASLAPTSGEALDWKNVEIRFTGKGGRQTLSIVSEATRFSEWGRGAQIGEIRLTENASATSGGKQGGTLALPAVNAALTDTDGSETLKLIVQGLPIGSMLTDGVRMLTTTASQPDADITGWNTATLKLTPPASFSGTLHLNVTATATEQANGATASVTRALDLSVAPVAQTPSLTLTAPDPVSRQLVNTRWDGQANRDKGATFTDRHEMDGWQVQPGHCGKDAGFAIWHANDQISVNGKKVTLQGAAGNSKGSGWLGLSNGVGIAATNKQGKQSPGIDRQIDTVAGARYTLNLAYAAWPGLTAANSRVGIYLDGQRIGGISKDGNSNGLDWQSLTVSFDGNGKQRQLSLVLEGATDTSTARGAMLDAIELIETLPNTASRLYAVRGTPVSLPIIDSRLAEGDVGTLKTELLGLPKGSVLNDGTRSLRLATANVPVDLAGWDLGRLQVTLPKATPDSLTLEVKAGSRVAANGATPESTATASRTFTLTLIDGTACANPVTLNPYVRSLNEGERGPIKLETGRLKVSTPEPEHTGCTIRIPERNNTVDPALSDEAYEARLAQLGERIEGAFLRDQERGR